jgi:hypothetical protein
LKNYSYSLDLIKQRRLRYRANSGFYSNALFNN